VYTAAQRQEHYLAAIGRHTIKRAKFVLDKKTMCKHLWNSLSADAITLCGTYRESKYETVLKVLS
jgi:hypothetical protein